MSKTPVFDPFGLGNADPEPSLGQYRRAWRLLDLIATEWDSDPKSIQCFDRRIVADAKSLLREERH